MKLALNETQFHKTVLGEFFHKKLPRGHFCFQKILGVVRNMYSFYKNKISGINFYPNWERERLLT
jgi:hypothetical protein